MEDFLYPFLSTFQSLPPWIQQLVGYAYRVIPTSTRFGAAYSTALKLLKESQWWSREQLAEYQLTQLSNLLRHAYANVPYYRQVFDERGLTPADITTLQDLRQLPFLTKEMIRQHRPQLVATNIPRSRWLYMNTGGSTGVPLELYYEKGVSRPREWAFMHTLWERVGWRDGDSLAVLRGGGLGDNYWRYESIRNRLVMSAYHVNDATLPAYIQKLRDFQPCFLHVYPSNLIVIARCMKKLGLPPIRSVKAILAGSENLFDAQRTLFEDVFDCRVYSWYGHGEIVALAGECEVSHELHLFPQYSVVELVKEDGTPVEEGEMGEIVGTGFNNYVMPLIRYRTADMGVYAKGPCECGREYPRLERLEGRKQELIVTREGSIVTLTGLIFGQHFHAFSHIKAMQLVQAAVGELAIKIVPEAEYFRQEGEREIQAKIRNAVGDALRLSFEYVEDLPRTTRGKHLFLIQHLQIEDYLN